MACEVTIYALKPKKKCTKYKMFVGCTTQTLDDRFAHHADWNKTKNLELYFAMKRDNFNWSICPLYKGFCTLGEAEKIRDRWIEVLQPNFQGEPNPALVGNSWKEKLDLAAEKKRKTLPEESRTEYVVQKSKTPEKAKTRCYVSREKASAYHEEYYRRNREKILAKQRAVYWEKKRDADLS